MGARALASLVCHAASPISRRAQADTIDKLRVANAALRRQLREFAKALDVSLNVAASTQQQGGDAKRGLLSEADRQDVEAALLSKEKQLKSALKKIEIYRCAAPRCCARASPPTRR